MEYAREQSFGDMELLHGGVISTGEKSANNAAYFAFNGKVSVLRSPIAENEEVIVPAICFRNHYSSQVRGIRLGLAGEPAEFYVEELTSADGTDDGITDFNLASAIADYDDGERVIRSSWRKTGPGTLTFPSGGKTIKVSSLSVTGNSYYTGDIFIDEGCVRVQLSAAGSGGKGGAMGNLWTNRTIYVNSGAKLELASSQVFGAATMPSLLATIVVSNGTYEIIHASKYQLQNTANVRVIGSGRLIYNDITGNSTEYSKTYFGGEMYFETDEPVTLPVASGVYLDYRTDLQEEVVDEKTINKFGFTEFCVMPTKVNPTNAADLVVYSTLRKHTDTTRFTGLKKTGSGVMALMAKNKYDYDTVVCDGGLYIDGAAEISSDAIVKNGGTIGGAGKIKGNLTIEENGGLLISATNMTSSLTVTGDVTLPTKGLLMIYDYDGTLDNLPSVAKGISLPNLASTSSLDTNGWRVRVKGFTDRETRNLTVIKEGDTLSIKKTSPGFCVIVK